MRKRARIILSGGLVVRLMTLAFGHALIIFAVPGVWPLVEATWRNFVGCRDLTAEEIAASRTVHPPGLIPYESVGVVEYSPISRIAQWFTGAPTAIATGRLVHLPTANVSPAVMVHELTHVAQYQTVGAIYMREAVLAQCRTGYDYGELSGKRLSGLNREQQATICEDFYRALHGQGTRYGATLADLEPLVDEMRRGELRETGFRA